MAGDVAGALYIQLLPVVTRKEFETTVKAATKSLSVDVKVGLSLKPGSKKDLQAEVAKATEGQTPTIEVGLDIKKGAAAAAVKSANAHIKTLRNKPSLSVGMSVTALAARQAITEANKRLKASTVATPKLKVQLDLDENQAKLLKETRVSVKQIELAFTGNPIEIPLDLDEKSLKTVAQKAAAARAVMQAQIDEQYQQQDKLRELGQLNAANKALAVEASTQARLTALTDAGLDQRTLLELREASQSELIAQRHAARMEQIASRALLTPERSGPRGQAVNMARSLRDDLSGLEFSTNRMLRTLTRSFGFFTAGVVGSFAAISGAAIYQFGVIEQAANKSASLFTAQALSSSNATGAAFERQLLSTSSNFTDQIIDKSRQVAVATKFNTQEIAEGFRFLGGAGVDMEQSLQSIDSIARLSQAGFMELESTSELLAQGFIASGRDINNFGSEVDALSDKLVFVANESAVTLEEALKAFANRSGASFVALGQDADEALNIIRLFGQTGIKGLKAGEQSSILIREIVRSTQPDRGADAWKKYGLSIKDANGKTKSFAKVIDDLTRVFARQTKGFKDPSALANVLKEFEFTEKSNAGLRQLLPSIFALQKRGLGAAEALRELREESTGRLEAQTKAVTNTLAFQFEAFTNNISNLASTFAESAGTQIKDFLLQLNGAGIQGSALFERLGGDAQDFGDRFGRVVNSILTQLTGAEGAAFFGGIVDGFESTLSGVGKAFVTFRTEVFGAGSNKGFLTVFGEAFAGIGRFADRTLPRIAQAVGRVVSAIKENEDEARSLVKFWVSVFVGAKLNRWFVLPLLGIAQNLGKVKSAIMGIGGAKAITALTAATDHMNLLKKSTQDTAKAAGLLDAAQAVPGKTAPVVPGTRVSTAAAAAAGVGAGAVGGGAALKGIDRLKSDLAVSAAESKALDDRSAAIQKIVDAAAEANKSEIARAEMLERQGLQLEKINELIDKLKIKNLTNAFSKMGTGLKALVPTLEVLGRAGVLFSRLAGWVGIAVIAIDFLIGVWQGFRAEFDKTLAGNKDAQKGFSDLKKVTREVGDAFVWAFDKLEWLMSWIRKAGVVVGKDFAHDLVKFFEVMSYIPDAIDATITAFKSLAGSVDNILAPIAIAIGMLFSDEPALDRVYHFAQTLIIGVGHAVADAMRRLVGDLSTGVSQRLQNAMGNLAVTAGNAFATVFLSVIKFAVGTGIDAIIASVGKLTSGALGKIPAVNAAGDSVKGKLEEVKGSLDDVQIEFSYTELAAIDAMNGVKFATDPIPKYLWNIRKAVWTLNPAWKTARQEAITAMGAIGRKLGQLRDKFGLDAASIEAALERVTLKLLAMQAESAATASMNAELARISDTSLTPEQHLAILERANTAGAEARSAMMIRNMRAHQQAVADAQKDVKVPAVQAPELGAPLPIDVPGLEDASAATQDLAAANTEVKDAATLAAEAVDKLTAAQFKQQAGSLIAKIAKDAGGAYKATTREAAILTRALPFLDEALEKQRTAVAALDTQMQSLQSTQLKGTKAAADAAFGFDQSVKKLQLQRLDLIIGGASTDDTAVADIDAQIAAIQQKSERAALAASIALDPLKKKLEDTFSPVAEMSFGDIIKQFNELSTVRGNAAASLAKNEALRAKLDAIIAKSADKFAGIGKSVSQGVANGINAGEPAIVQGAVDTSNAYLNGLDSVFKFGSPSKTTTQMGLWVSQGMAAGILSGRGAVIDSTRAIRSSVMTVLENGVNGANMAGRRIMTGFYKGMNKVWEETVKPFVTEIAEWIRDNKGPISYDRQILKPAGQAMMEGFHEGLSDGFGEIKGWVRKVAPTLAGDTLAKELIFRRSASFLMDNVKFDQQIDPETAFADLMPRSFFGELGFLHKTRSAADTQKMAERLMSLYPGEFNFDPSSAQFLRAEGSTSNNSRHEDGVAVDLGNGGAPTRASLELFSKLKPLLGSVFAELIHNGFGFEAGGGVWGPAGHFDHIHAEFLEALDFDKFSGKLGSGIGGNLTEIITAAAQAYGASAQGLIDVALAESSLDPTAFNNWDSNAAAGTPSRGLFQFIEPTFNDFMPDAIAANPTIWEGVTRDWLDPIAQALVAAWAFTHGKGSHWATFSSYGGRRAMGGPMNAGTAYHVNERGDELFVPGRGGTMISNKDFRDLIVAMQAHVSGGTPGAPLLYDQRTVNVHSNSNDPAAVAALVDARMRAQIAGVSR